MNAEENSMFFNRIVVAGGTLEKFIKMKYLIHELTESSEEKQKRVSKKELIVVAIKKTKLVIGELTPSR